MTHGLNCRCKRFQCKFLSHLLISSFKATLSTPDLHQNLTDLHGRRRSIVHLIDAICTLSTTAQDRCDELKTCNEQLIRNITRLLVFI